MARVGQPYRPFSGVLRASCLAIAAGLAAPVVVVPQLAEAQTFRFNSVEVRGNQRVDTASILSFAGIGRGEAVSAAQVNDAQRRILDSGLFESVEITPRGSTLVIEVREFPTINVIDFQGNRRLKDEDLETIIQSRSRRVFNPSQAESDADAITDAYRQSGRISASVLPKVIRRSDNRVDLVFEIIEGGVSEIERISFVGNRKFSDRRLRGLLETRQAGIFRQLSRRDTLIEDRLEFDRQILRDFYLSPGYIDAQVLATTPELTRNRDGFLVTFNVREGQQFRFGEVTVVSDIDSVDTDEYLDALRAGFLQTSARAGQVYNPAIVDNAIARLERLAIQQGLNFVRVEPRVSRNDRDLTLDVEFAVTRGPRVFVERIDIEGNATTLDRVVRRQFRVVEGDPFNPRQIRESAERIRALGYFSQADVNAREGSAPDQVIVDVDVEETTTGSLGFGASYSQNGGLGFNINFTERNFLGRGQSLSFEINTTDSTQAYSFSFTEPAFLGRDLAFGFDANFRESEQDNATFDTKRGVIRPRFSFPVSERGRLSLRASANYSELLNVDQGDPIGTTDPTQDTGSSFILRQEEDQYWDTSIGYSYSFDSRRTGLNPNAGVLFRFTQDLGFGDERRYLRTTAFMSAQTRIFNESVTLRAEIEGGAVNFFEGNSTVLDRFNLSRQMRGFEPNGLGPRDLNVTNLDALGGNYYAVARLEAEFPLPLPEEYGISGGVFLDYGSVWGLDNVMGGPDGLSPVDDGFIARSAVGISIFWDSALGPLRFNFSEALQAEDFDETQSFDFVVETRF